MIMPLPAVRGIVCTWPFGAKNDAPEVRELTGEEAERVRIGLHAIAGGMVDCGSSPRPTYTAVVEDRTGTRRAVTIIDSECSTVIRSDQGYGLGFAWLDRSRTGSSLPWWGRSLRSHCSTHHHLNSNCCRSSRLGSPRAGSRRRPSRWASSRC